VKLHINCITASNDADQSQQQATSVRTLDDDKLIFDWVGSDRLEEHASGNFQMGWGLMGVLFSCVLFLLYIWFLFFCSSCPPLIPTFTYPHASYASLLFFQNLSSVAPCLPSLFPLCSMPMIPPLCHLVTCTEISTMFAQLAIEHIHISSSLQLRSFSSKAT